MYIRDIIIKKRNKEALNDEEINFAIQGYFKDQISDAQMAALMTAIHINGLNDNERLYFINSMAETGKELELYRISNKIVDIHVLGGISDKIILILLAVIHSLGYPAAKVIGRELGMEDRLLSIPGYKLEDDINTFKLSIQNNGVGILKSIQNLAPIEEKLYHLRHEIACDNDISLIAMSIMSQKIALGFYNIFFEITYGANAYVKTFEEAKMLAKCLTEIGKKEMRNVACAVTPLNEIVGSCFGNALEMREIYDFLSGKKDTVMYKELEEVVLNFGSNILSISTDERDLNKNKKKILENVENGKALQSFEKIISLGGGDVDALKTEVKAKCKIPVMADEEGFISEIDVNQLRQLAKYLNAIRAKEDDLLDFGSGVAFYKKIGDNINKGEIIADIYTNNETKIAKSVACVKELFKISDKKIKDTSRITYNT